MCYDSMKIWFAVPSRRKMCIPNINVWLFRFPFSYDYNTTQSFTIYLATCYQKRMLSPAGALGESRGRTKKAGNEWKTLSANWVLSPNTASPYIKMSRSCALLIRNGILQARNIKDNIIASLCPQCAEHSNVSHIVSVHRDRKTVEFRVSSRAPHILALRIRLPR